MANNATKKQDDLNDLVKDSSEQDDDISPGISSIEINAELNEKADVKNNDKDLKKSDQDLSHHKKIETDDRYSYRRQDEKPIDNT